MSDDYGTLSAYYKQCRWYCSVVEANASGKELSATRHEWTRSCQSAPVEFKNPPLAETCPTL
jgi:hypothetical protein